MVNVFEKETIMKKKILCFILLFFCQCKCQNMIGFEFKDNLLEDRFGPENGYAIYDTGLYTQYSPA